ncbi:unnamed protein product [Alopecurus aequalis]
MAENSLPNPGQPVWAEGVLRELERAASPRRRPSAPEAVGARAPKPEQPSRAGEVLRDSAERAAPARSRASALEAARGRDTRRSSWKRHRHLQREIRGLCRVGGQGSRRFGDVLSAVSSSIHRPVYYEAECDMAYVDSFDQTPCSSDKENVNPGRKRCWDDALFQFFRSEAIKSLKNDFSSFLSESHAWRKMHLADDQSIGRDDFYSYSLKYYGEVLKSLSSHQKRVIQKFGFGSLLLFQKTHIPSSFVRWLVSCVDPISSQIIIDDSKVISLSKSSMHHVIGLPIGGSVPMPESDRGANLILSMFGLTELPHITFFGNKLKSLDSLIDKEILLCFITVSFKCFLFPTMGDYPNTDFVHILEEPESAHGVDLCLLVYDHVISGIFKFIRFCKLNGRKPRVFEFCYYFLSVYYLDSLDFGARIVDQTVPRISVWNGNLINLFSELDYRKKNLFGKRHLKKILACCYREFGGLGDAITSTNVPPATSGSSFFPVGFKENLHLRFGSFIDAKVIDGIVHSVLVSPAAKDVIVTNVLHFLMDFKSAEVKSHQYHPKFPVAGSHTAAPDNNGVAASGFVGANNGSESEENYAPHSLKCATAVSNKTAASMNHNVTNKTPIHVSPAPIKMPATQSPEVEITGCRSSHNHQVELSKNIDDLYNQMANYSSNQEHIGRSSKAKSSENDEECIVLSDKLADDILQKDSLVILQAKKPLILPLPPNTRFPVTDLEIKHFCAIVDLAYTPVVQKDYAVMYSKVHCSYISLGQSLQREGHVDNFLIPVFCRKLFEDNHPSRSLRHNFFSFIGETILSYNNDAQLDMISRAFLGAASASKGKRLELSNNLFFPICRSKHWFTFCVDFKYKLFIFLDSYYSKEDDFHKSIKDKLIKNFIKLWKIIFKSDGLLFKKFGSMYAYVPKQGNPDDCGVFTMKFMESYRPELDMRTVFSKDDIVHLRILYANDLFFVSATKLTSLWLLIMCPRVIG